METNSTIINITKTENKKENPVSKNTFADHGSEIEEIVSNRLPLIVKLGTVFLLGLLMILIATCWFIKYPDIIKAPAILTSINAPKPVINITEGKLIKLNTKENQKTNKGSIVGIMESTASHQEVIQLSHLLDTIQVKLNSNQTENIPSLLLVNLLQLGELQNAYQTFYQAFLNFKNYLPTGFYPLKIDLLKKELINLKHLHSNLLEQKQLQEQDLLLAKKTMDANESLKHNNIISDLNYRTEKSKLINKQLALPQTRAALIINKNLQNDKQKEITELTNTIDQQKSIFQQALNTFESQIDIWKKEYLLIAPITGTVTFATFIQENQQLKANQTICFINPEKAEYYAEITIPQANFGKVSIGQTVLLKFNSYPHQEYGMIKGVIEFISNIPSNEGYLAKVNFINGLTTNHNKQIQYRTGLTANAEIITKDLRLLQRFYHTLIQQLSR